MNNDEIPADFYQALKECDEMTKTEDSAETTQVGYFNDQIVNVQSISDAVIAQFRAELLNEIDKLLTDDPYSKKFDHPSVEKIREIVEKYKF
jgi:hypothetical protein